MSVQLPPIGADIPMLATFCTMFHTGMSHIPEASNTGLYFIVMAYFIEGFLILLALPSRANSYFI